MIDFVKYIKDIVGIECEIHPMDKLALKQLPIYLRNTYHWYDLVIMGRQFIIAYSTTCEDFSIAAIDHQLSNIEDKLNRPVILCVEELEAYNRKRLIEKKRAFIIPFKQMYIPHLFMDLTEYRYQTKVSPSRYLQPFAQAIVIAHLLNRNNEYQIEKEPLMNIAKLFDVNTINVSRAVGDLETHGFIETYRDGRYKLFNFKMDKKELWNYGLEKKLFTNPITKLYYSDQKSHFNSYILNGGDMALAYYTNINPTDQIVYAMDNATFNLIKKNNPQNVFNEDEGLFCWQVWKYDPILIHKVNQSFSGNVDPLSLYLTYREDKDARVQIELENLINKFIW